jgi:hypothetical protein
MDHKVRTWSFLYLLGTCVYLYINSSFSEFSEATDLSYDVLYETWKPYL